MLRKTLIYCGLVVPVLYVITVIIGAALRHDYSHIVNAVSELLSNGAPNKAVLDFIFNIHGALLLAFAIGGYSVLKNASRLCRIAMSIFIAIQVLSFSWGFFPMDPMGTQATFAGTMHNILGGIVALVTIILPLLMGLGFTAGGWFSKLCHLFILFICDHFCFRPDGSHFSRARHSVVWFLRTDYDRLL